jgi:hypothetical protein
MQGATATNGLTARQMSQIGMAYARRWNAQLRIREIQKQNPMAICPSADELVAFEAQGMVWNFESGQAEGIDA